MPAITIVTNHINMEWSVTPENREALLAELMEVLEEWAETTRIPFDLRID